MHVAMLLNCYVIIVSISDFKYQIITLCRRRLETMLLNYRMLEFNLKNLLKKQTTGYIVIHGQLTSVDYMDYLEKKR